MKFDHENLRLTMVVSSIKTDKFKYSLMDKYSRTNVIQSLGVKILATLGIESI